MSLRPVLLASLAAVAAAALSLSSAMTTSGPARAEGGHSLVIPANDGYGMGECLLEGKACGRVIADAWCEAQGFGKSESFGPADPTEVTASLATKAAPQTAPKAFTVTCRD
ncbi:MAG: hypothetical protein U1E62_11135 [Alsobacter sp.]